MLHGVGRKWHGAAGRARTNQCRSAAGPWGRPRGRRQTRCYPLVARSARARGAYYSRATPDAPRLDTPPSAVQKAYAAAESHPRTVGDRRAPSANTPADHAPRTGFLQGSTRDRPQRQGLSADGSGGFCSGGGQQAAASMMEAFKPEPSPMHTTATSQRSPALFAGTPCPPLAGRCRALCARCGMRPPAGSRRHGPAGRALLCLKGPDLHLLHPPAYPTPTRTRLRPTAAHVPPPGHSRGRRLCPSLPPRHRWPAPHPAAGQGGRRQGGGGGGGRRGAAPALVRGQQQQHRLLRALRRLDVIAADRLPASVAAPRRGRRRQGTAGVR